jgi:acyl-CoA thioester hydrolase
MSEPVRSSVRDELTGARVTMRRRLAWAETDAAGHNHFSVAVRWLEEAEHLLWRSLGLASMVPQVPRVHIEVDYHRRIYFEEEVEVTVGVITLGRSSLTLGFEVRSIDGTLAQSGRHTVVHAPDTSGEARPWTDETRELLLAIASY